MPELPEVETVKRTLSPVLGARVTGLVTSGKALRLGRPIDVRGLERAAVGRRFSAVHRLGKYLLLAFDGGTEQILVHLGMSGRLRLAKRDDPPFPHTHVCFELTRRRQLRFSDPRRFGQVEVVLGDPREHPSLGKLGPDPLTEGLDPEALHRQARRSTRAIKTFILDQTVIAGVGNIYASEALFQARIPPGLASNRVSLVRMKALAAAVKDVMVRALEHGGTSLRDFVHADGSTGDHSHYLVVYDREGHSCPRRGCAGTIRRRIIQGRSTFYCPMCQSR